MHRMIFLIVPFIILFVGCKDSSLKSHYTQENIAIDGKLDEWSKFPLQHFEDEHFSVSFLNNKNIFYLVLATRDRQMMRIVQTSGVNIWVDLNKKKKKLYGLHYIGNIDSLDFSQMKMNMPPDVKIKKRNKFQAGSLLFTKNGNEQLIKKFKLSDPKASVDMYKSVYILEVRIPFDSDDIFANLKENEIKKIQVGIELGIDRSAMKKQMKSSRSGGIGGGGRGGGMDGGGGRGRGGSKMGGGQGLMRRPQPMGKIEKWFTVALERKI